MKPEGMSAEEWAAVEDMPRALKETALSLWHNMRRRPSTEGQPPPTAQARRPIQLPLWPEPKRGTPNSFLRSALFSAIQGKTRKYIKGQLIASQANYEISFKGEQLDQSDLDPWEQAAHLARKNPDDLSCMFKGGAFLKAMGRSTGRNDYEWLNESLERLVACAVTVKINKKTAFTGSLVSSFFRDDETRVYKVNFDKDTLALFLPDDWTALEWQERLALKGKPLALWLHGYYSSHAAPHPVKVETLRDMCGSETKEPRFFKKALLRAFEELEQVTGIKGTIDGDLVTVTHTPSPAQICHLARKTTRRKRGI